MIGNFALVRGFPVPFGARAREWAPFVVFFCKPAGKKSCSGPALEIKIANFVAAASREFRESPTTLTSRRPSANPRAQISELKRGHWR